MSKETVKYDHLEDRVNCKEICSDDVKSISLAQSEVILLDRI